MPSGSMEQARVVGGWEEVLEAAGLPCFPWQNPGTVCQHMRTDKRSCMHSCSYADWQIQYLVSSSAIHRTHPTELIDEGILLAPAMMEHHRLFQVFEAFESAAAQEVGANVQAHSNDLDKTA